MDRIRTCWYIALADGNLILDRLGTLTGTHSLRCNESHHLLLLIRKSFLLYLDIPLESLIRGECAGIRVNE